MHWFDGWCLNLLHSTAVGGLVALLCNIISYVSEGGQKWTIFASHIM